VESELDERFFLVHIQLSEDFSGIEKMGVINNLLDIEGKEWKVENQRNPISIDEEQKGEETMNRSFWNDVGVQTVAEIDRVDVVTFKIAVHNSEEDL